MNDQWFAEQAVLKYECMYSKRASKSVYYVDKLDEEMCKLFSTK